VRLNPDASRFILPGQKHSLQACAYSEWFGLAMSAQSYALSARQFHRRAACSFERRRAANEICGRVFQRNLREGLYEISSFDCDFDGTHRHSDGNVARDRLLQGQRKMLSRQVL
jgi:hypothetical protein